MPDEDGYFDEPVAANYDEDANEMFSAEVVNPTAASSSKSACRISGDCRTASDT
jgi:hypothetical protein